MCALSAMGPSKLMRKRINRQIKRRRDGLFIKCYKYGKQLGGIELALCIRYTDTGEFHAYQSERHLPWLSDLAREVS